MGATETQTKGESMNRTQQKLQTAIKPGYLRRAQAARYLSISLRTLADLQQKRIIPFSKIGSRTVLFKLTDLDAAIDRWRVEAIGA